MAQGIIRGVNGIYLDWAATAPPYPDLSRAAAELAVDLFGNPSSAHAAGRAAKTAFEEARKRLAKALGCAPGHVKFTSGGSEANAIVLLSLVYAASGGSVVISAIEHSAVYEQAMVLERFGIRVRVVKPGPAGIVRPGDVADAVDADTRLVSIMAVNNETGAIQPIGDIVSAVRDASKGFRKAPFVHSDAVQAFGKIGFKPAELCLDAASMSAHKLGGPRGSGCLYLARGLDVLVRGGGQEDGIRPGTHNLAGACAFSQAAERACADLPASLGNARSLEARLLNGLRSIPGARVLPDGRVPASTDYSPYIVGAAFPGLGGETLARVLDDQGIYVSTGAACSHAKKERRVMDAMGVDRDLSFSAVRISTGRDSTAADIDRFLEAAESAYRRYKT